MNTAFHPLGSKWTPLTIWTLLIVLSAGLYVESHTDLTDRVARMEADSLYRKLFAYRHWNARAGGVYVPITAETPPNPYLANVKDRDVTTPSGQRLTLMNPAYMLRYILETSADDKTSHGRLVSLKPINPSNAPDPWEHQALLAFEQGSMEVAEERRIDGHDYFTLMRPLMVEASCLKCHAGQGYRVGDVRGALSASVAISPLRSAGYSRLLLALLGHLLVWGGGCKVIQVLSEYFQKYASRSQKLTEALNRAANFDKLTGLPNQVQFGDRLRWAMAQGRERGEGLAVLCLDLDHFKKVNNVFGHDGGDQVLAEIGRRITNNLRQTDLVARLGGDSFTVLLTSPTRPEESVAVAGKLRDAIHQPFLLDGHDLVLTASVGIACFPQDGSDPQTLLKHADTALQRAKEVGRDGCQIYAPAMNRQAMERLQLEIDLRRGLQNDEFLLYYQPQIDVGTGQVVGAEALLRWQHPRHGLLGPQEFITTAEETGLIVPLGDWVLRSVCQQIRAWREAGGRATRIAVNLSPRQFRQNGLEETIARLIEETEIPAESLGLEITESAIMHDTGKAVSTLGALRALGVHISIDDFGTGYSSLSQLKTLPVDVLKIDRSFVHDIPDNPDSISIINAIVALARNLNLKVLAEGAETEPQFQLLQQLQCHEAQGYLISAPIPSNDFCHRYLL